MTKRLFDLALLTLLGVFVLLSPAAAVRGQTGPFINTIPTRTPTPVPGSATATPVPQPTSPPGATPPPGATQPPPQATDVPPTDVPPIGTLPATTATPTATATRSRAGGPPADAQCDVPPTAQMLFDTTILRAGPGSNYALVTQAAYLAEFPIVGRYGFAQWWQVDLGNGLLAWVANNVVLVNGYTGLVPTVAAPALNGATPTPGARWQPTPFPFCTVTPTVAATATATATACATPARGSAESGTTTTQSDAPAAATTTDTSAPAAPTQAPDAPVSPTDAPPTADGAAGAVAAAATATPQPATSPTVEPTLAPLVATNDSGGSAWLLYVGGTLIAGAAAAFVLGRRQAAPE